MEKKSIKVDKIVEGMNGSELAYKVKDAILNFRKSNLGEMPDFVLLHVDHRNALLDYMYRNQMLIDTPDKAQLLGVKIIFAMYMSDEDKGKVFTVSMRGGRGINLQL